MKNEGTILVCSLTVYEPKSKNTKQFVKLDTPFQGMGFTDESLEKICSHYELFKIVPTAREEDDKYIINKFSCKMRVY